MDEKMKKRLQQEANKIHHDICEYNDPMQAIVVNLRRLIKKEEHDLIAKMMMGLLKELENKKNTETFNEQEEETYCFLKKEFRLIYEAAIKNISAKDQEDEDKKRFRE